MTPEEIAKQAAQDFYGAPGINEDWEKWLTGEIEKYGKDRELSAWQEVKKAWGEGYFSLTYVMDRIEEIQTEADEVSQ